METVQGSVDTVRDGLLAAMRHSTEPMVLSNPRLPDNPIVAVNAAFEALTQYPAIDVVGRNCRFLQGRQTDPDTVGRMGADLRAGHGCVQWLVNYRRDGRAFWNLLFISPVFAADGTLAYFFANQHDLSGEEPLDMAHVALGVAHMPAPAQDEFRALVSDMARQSSPESDARSLEGSLAAARRLAALSMKLEPGAAPGA